MGSKKKINCWEIQKCGREPGGIHAEAEGVCPAANHTDLDGFNLGTNAGRICWLVAGTFCGGTAQGSFAEKKKSCMDCEFYKQVHDEEGLTRLATDTENIVALTNIGLKYKTNEDRYFINQIDDETLLVAVADGLGGEVAGDYAAEIIRGRLSGIRSVPPGEEQAVLVRLALDTDAFIDRKLEDDPTLEGMGTTLVCALVRNHKAHWVHVGDSRLYLFHRGELNQVTEDQKLARFLVKEGEITAEQVPTHYSRHIMDQYIGCGYCEPESGVLALDPGDLMVLTTDGLHQKISDQTMPETLDRPIDIETKAAALVDAALTAGGKDNITILIMEVGATRKS